MIRTETAEIVQIFKDRGFKATPQRIAVYKYLCEHRTHPDVESVYRAVLEDNPAFSKTTVYNALQALDACGLIIPVTIDSGRIHYDADTRFHGHFRHCLQELLGQIRWNLSFFIIISMRQISCTVMKIWES